MMTCRSERKIESNDMKKKNVVLSLNWESGEVTCAELTGVHMTVNL